jgi:hypothetical protein
LATINGPFILDAGVRYRIRNGPGSEFAWRAGSIAEFDVMRSGHGAVPAVARIQLTSVSNAGNAGTYEFRGLMARTALVIVGLYTPSGLASHGTIRLAPEG